MKNIYLLCFFLLFLQHILVAQMPINGEIRYGNEWLQDNQPYLKIPVAQDGIYRISYETLAAAGFPISGVDAKQYQLYYFGNEMPLFTSNDGILTNGDFIEFYAKKNRGELDRFLYRNGEIDILNPHYSMFTDTSFYFLTIAPTPGNPLRYQKTTTELNNLPGKEAWFFSESIYLYNNSFFYAEANNANESVFDRGEGYGREFGKNTALRIIPALSQYAIGTAPCQINVQFNTITSNVAHRILFSIGSQVAQEEAIPGFQMRNYAQTLTTLSPADTIKLIDTTGRMGVAFVKIRYPHTFHFENQSQYYFKLNGSNTEKYLEIENFNSQGGFAILYDLTGRQRIETKVEEGKVKVKLAPFSGEKEFYLINPTTSINHLESSKLSIFNFNNIIKNQGDYIIIASRKLRQDASGMDQVQQYADYRHSKEGGSFNPVIIHIEDLYDQFAYGIQRHPLAIRNFAHYIKEKWSNPKFILILGKGREFNEIRTYNANIDTRFFVPTFGYPGSDNLLTASNTSQVPVIPIGRIAATKPADIALYLEKLRDYENPPSQAAENRAWRKQIIHLGGGEDSNQQTGIESAMDGMKNIISNNYYGANVNTYYKRSNDVTQRIESEEINGLLQEGVGIITFFGHGGPTVIDISIGDPATYSNYRQYPVMFALGCNSGNIHIPGISYSENFVFQSNKAGIAFIGTSSEGFIGDLGPFQRTYYDLLGNTMYGKSIGEVMQASIQQHDANNSPYRRMLLQQYTIHGDPALKISPYNAPDYIIDRESVQFNPSTVSIQEDSFELKFNILNIGKNNNKDSLSIKITRHLPTGIQKIVSTKIKAPAYQSDLLHYKFPVSDSSGSTAGFNDFFITLDPDNQINELPNLEAEANNELKDIFGTPGKKLFIFDKGITPVAPLNYAIVNNTNLKLQASTANVFETEQRYRFEIDTSKYFNNPLSDTLFLTTGGVLEWQPKIALLDSTVYYWRVAIDSLIEDKYNWSTSSFTYIKDSPLGWRQGHFQQLQENDFQEMSLPDSTRRLSFSENPSYIDYNIFSYPGGFSNTSYYVYSSINTTTNQYLGGINNGGVIVCVFDGSSGDPWQNHRLGGTRGEYSSVIGQTWADVIPSFPYSTTAFNTRKNVMNFLKDTIPDGSYVFLYTIQHTGSGLDYKPEQWAADSLQNSNINLFNLLEAEGAMEVRRTVTEGAKPYAILYRKGSGKAIFEQLANTVQDTISGNLLIPGFKTEGSTTSRRIGPARHWASLQKQFNTDEYDAYSIDLYGIDKNSAKTSLLTNVTAADTSLEWINADVYPYLELQLNARDSVKRTPAQFGYWQVLYEGIPEAALNPLVQLDIPLPKDTIQQGEPLKVNIAISNLSHYDMDSLLVHYTTISENNNVKLNSIRLKPLPKQEISSVELILPSQDLRGKYELLIEINPTEDQPDQPELYHFNNIGALYFYVESDKRNPLVDVTFDGIRILNGDLVSAKPQIVVSLRDENQYLALIDTTTMELSIQYEDEPAERISFNQLRFEPAKPDGKENKATIYYEPEFISDGTYTLYVNGKDASDNEAGKTKYQVKFEVITKAMISNVFNYPNPFTSSTQFFYTLTGAEPPAQYKIQIMSISGRIVRELTELDLGPLRIGTHRTELAWDGTDQYGDRLANGVYLYRVIAKDQSGKDYEKYENGTDRFFKKNIGKLVILR